MIAKILQIPLNHLKIDGNTQARCHTNEEVAEEYAEAIRAGDEFPPVVAFGDRPPYWLADGFTRLRAHEIVGRKYINVDVRRGDQRAALFYAIGANTKNGQRMKSEDKRRAITILVGDPEWCQYGMREIARIVGCSPTTVWTVINQLKEIKKRLEQAIKTRPKGEEHGKNGDIQNDKTDENESNLGSVRGRLEAVNRTEDSHAASDANLVLHTKDLLTQARAFLVDLGDVAERAVVAVDVAVDEVGRIVG